MTCFRKILETYDRSTEAGCRNVSMPHERLCDIRATAGVKDVFAPKRRRVEPQKAANVLSSLSNHARGIDATHRFPIIQLPDASGPFMS